MVEVVGSVPGLLARTVAGGRLEEFGNEVAVEGGPLHTPRGPTHGRAGPARETVVQQEVVAMARPRYCT